MKKLGLLIFSLLVLVLFTSCGGGSSNNDDSNAIVFYLNSNPFEDDNIKFEVVEPMCYEGEDDYTVVFGFNVTNKTDSKQTYKVKNVSLKNSNGKSFRTYAEDHEVESKSSDVYFIYGNTSTDIKDDKYQASFKFGDYSIKYYLYENNNSGVVESSTNNQASQSSTNNQASQSSTNNQASQSSTNAAESTNNNASNVVITFYIKVNSSLYKVNEASVKSGSTLPSYVYEDVYTYNDTWYLNSSCTNKITSSTTFTSDQSVYGVRKDNFDFADFTNYYQINDVKHVPSNGVLVIPSDITTKIYDLGNKSGINSIYVPKTTIYIDNTAFSYIKGNFKVYYAGTETEWKSLFFAESYAFTSNVVFNASYSQD